MYLAGNGGSAGKDWSVCRPNGSSVVEHCSTGISCMSYDFSPITSFKAAHHARRSVKLSVLGLFEHICQISKPKCRNWILLVIPLLNSDTVKRFVLKWLHTTI